MGSACCIAARDRTVINGSSSDIMSRNVRYSPSWSFRWDNRGRVAEEETSVNWLSDGVGTNDRLDNKSQTTIETANASEAGSPLEGFQSITRRKSPPSEGKMVCTSGPLNARNPREVMESTETPVDLEPSPTNMSPPPHLLSSFSISPISSSHGGHPPPSNSTVSRRHHLSPGWSNESNSASQSHGGSSDGFSELGFGGFSEPLSFGGRVSSPSVTQICGVCSRRLSDKSWGSQKIMATNELDVVAILICGHVYHAECLESMTTGTNKYDPACPVCNFGEIQTLKLSEKALRADMELKAKITKKLRRRGMDGDSIVFQGPQMSSSSSMKSSIGKPFLRKHFLFGSKRSRSLSESKSSWKNGFLWGRSGKE
ncbi:uncharacterized protein LOC112500095 [Cynara cardunculus var. scolymus]|uniref:RING-type domain-containing protein n=1 Tax=Cynara cardunculus var. scolymus TaxID=59895 RepID=A0A103Y3T2_CYNCS|nr:uncharacterized protein LOC112500095 [Cynara cardunculus var. scolymus]XP_024959154.1 uncharacterized protein LOC112500095 [Cynara cardunculus var. scolymus]XP_024959155.1 uncharacterized protein LOC112500095 [Cynara cardunculus var. scolymus]XP_024959156.1 uncharacterized protein LOC112500095 [Cynara cardunculus var. scolymus]KVI02007.1 hypothetical protein Ccrd_019710 [Cynara cardunculus var. scolymus]